MFYAAQNSFHESLLFLCKSVNLLLLFINLNLAHEGPREVIVARCLYLFLHVNAICTQIMASFANALPSLYFIVTQFNYLRSTFFFWWRFLVVVFCIYSIIIWWHHQNSTHSNPIHKNIARANNFALWCRKYVLFPSQRVVLFVFYMFIHNLKSHVIPITIAEIK